MKRIILMIFVAVWATVLEVAAVADGNSNGFVDEGTPRALGLRIGGNVGITYQHGLTEDTFCELDIYLPGYCRGVIVSSQYEWLRGIRVQRGDLNWYYGGGVGIGFLWGDIPASLVGVVPQVGIEYLLEGSPIQLSLDYAPFLGISIGDGVRYYGGGMSNIALSVRFRF